MYIVISNQFAWLLLFFRTLITDTSIFRILIYSIFRILIISIFRILIFFLFLEPPSAPQNVREVAKTNNRIELRWLPPRYNGGRNDVYYRIECDKCDSSVQYGPGKDNINVTRSVLFYLDSLSTKCALYSKKSALYCHVFHFHRSFFLVFL